MSTLKRCFGSCAGWRRCGESVSDGNRGQGLAFDGLYGHALWLSLSGARVQEVLKHDPLSGHLFVCERPVSWFC